MQNQWRDFFDSHAPEYMENVFTRNTIAEIDFIMAELGLKPGDRVLDVGCGTGRHAVELARRGCRVTGIDLSSGMLHQARNAARRAGVEIDLIQANAAKFTVAHEFRAAICLCEGAFGLLGKDDDPIERDLSILKNIHDALMPGGRFILTALSALRTIRMYSPDDIDAGKFDPIRLTETSVMSVESPEGPKSFTVYERAYVATELALMHRLAGLEIENIYGGTAGNWGRRGLDPDEYEIMAISRKK